MPRSIISRDSIDTEPRIEFVQPDSLGCPEDIGFEHQPSTVMLEYVLLQLRQLPEDTVKPFLREQKTSRSRGNGLSVTKLP